METSNQKFLKWFQEFYSHEFQELSQAFKNYWIEEILFNNSAYIDKDYVVSHSDWCDKCGRCCEAQGCLDYDADTRLCTRHDNPIDDLCKTFPWTGEDFGVAPLNLNCVYTIRIFTHFFDNFFSTEVKRNASRDH